MDISAATGGGARVIAVWALSLDFILVVGVAVALVAVLRDRRSRRR